MHGTLANLLDTLHASIPRDAGVITWGSPVPAFGNPASSRLATLGINPSSREFLDANGNELRGHLRRFHTLRSLGLSSWGDADSRHLREMVLYCQGYFHRNPYDRWFRVLDRLVSTAGVSYYRDQGACHLDLIPYATMPKWTGLTSRQRATLLQIGAKTLGRLIADSPIHALVLNGRSVVVHFQHSTGTTLRCQPMREWSLPRKTSPVAGYAYQGSVNSIQGVDLGRSLVVLGFNHNLQSSFGVTTKVLRAIRRWVGTSLKDIVP